MTLTPELLIALSGLITVLSTALSSLVGKWMADRSQALRDKTLARKDEVELLHKEIDRFSRRVETLESDNQHLWKQNERLSRDGARCQRNNASLSAYIAILRHLMIEAGIKVPEMPVLERAIKSNE